MGELLGLLASPSEQTGRAGRVCQGVEREPFPHFLPSFCHPLSLQACPSPGGQLWGAHSLNEPSQRLQGNLGGGSREGSRYPRQAGKQPCDLLQWSLCLYGGGEGLRRVADYRSQESRSQPVKSKPGRISWVKVLGGKNSWGT